MTTDEIKVNMTPSHPRRLRPHRGHRGAGAQRDQAAAILGVRRVTLSDLLGGKASLSLEMALRIENLATLRREAVAWNRRVNRERVKIDWRFDRQTARRKFGYKKPEWGIHLTQVAPRRCGLVDPWTPAHCTQNAPWGARRRSAGNWATRLRFGPIKDYARAMAIAGLETWCYRQAFPGAANGQPQYVVVT